MPASTSLLSPAWKDWIECLGRCLLGALFMHEGASKLLSYGDAVAYMGRYGMPPLLLPAAIAVEIGAGAMVTLGWRTRAASALLVLFCLAAALVFHVRWGDRNQLLHFEKDLALAGAFLVIWVRGAGRISIDRGLRASDPVEPSALEIRR